jgi:hypothetical protein
LRRYVPAILTVVVILLVLIIAGIISINQSNPPKQQQYTNKIPINQSNPPNQQGILLCVAFDQSLYRPDTGNYMIQGEASVIYLTMILSKGNLRNVTVANLSSTLENADLYLIFVSGEERVEFSGRKMVVSANSSESIAAAVDRLLLELSKNINRGLDQNREYLVIADPNSGKRFGIPWLGKLSMERVARVPVTGDPSEIVKLLKG